VFIFELTGPPQVYLENALNVQFPSQWRMVHENVQWFGNTITQDIGVTCEAVEQLPENEGLSDPVDGPTEPVDNLLVSKSLLFTEAPIPTSLNCGETGIVSMKAINMGDSTWTHEDKFAFGAWGNSNYFGNFARVSIPEGEEVSPGESWFFSFEIDGPPVSFMKNIHNPQFFSLRLEWSMIREDVEWFGKHLVREISVTCPELNEE